MTIKRWWTPAEDELARVLAARGWTHARIGRAVGGRSKQAVTSRLRLLRVGLSRRAWTAEEDATLRDTAGFRTCAQIAATLGRTPEAVHTRASLLGIHWQRRDPGRTHSGFTANEVARLLGVPCAKAVTDWIAKGYLVAARRAPRMDRGPRLAFRVYPEALRDFLRDYPWLYRRERIADRGWRAYAETLPREEWIGTGEAARLLYLTVEGVALAIRKGDIRAEKVGANWVIPMSAIRAYTPPPIGGAGQGRGRKVGDDLAARRARNLAARKSWTYTLRPETVAAARASRAARQREAA